MADRTSWYVNHPPACTCVRCERDRAAGGRTARPPGRRRRQSRRVEQPDHRFASRRPGRPRSRSGGGRRWLWAIAIVALLALVIWYGRDDIASLVSNNPPAPPVAAIAPTQTPTPPKREAAAALIATATPTAATQSTVEATLGTPTQTPIPPAVQPTATPEPPSPTVTPTSSPSTAPPTRTAVQPLYDTDTLHIHRDAHTDHTSRNAYSRCTRCDAGAHYTSRNANSFSGHRCAIPHPANLNGCSAFPSALQERRMAGARRP